MKLHDVEQGTPEWYAARTGVFTASDFGKILTPKTLSLSKQAEELENKIVAEILTGQSTEAFNGNGWTQRGKELEAEAVLFYEGFYECETQRIGFATNDEGTIGCSPDRFVGDDGLLEIKCPAPHNHVKLLLDGMVGEDHKPQIQGQLLVTGRKWVDAFSYHPEIKPSIIRVGRDEGYIEMLAAALATLVSNVQTKLNIIRGN